MGMLVIRIVILIVLRTADELILGAPVFVAITIGAASTSASTVQALPRAVDTGVGTLVAGGAAAAGEVAGAQWTTTAATRSIVATPVVVVHSRSTARRIHPGAGG